MSTIINEKVQVWVKFDSTDRIGKIFPVAMDWNNRRVKFKNLIFKSAHRVGEKRFLSLVCESESANFELEFDTESYVWWLKRVIAE